MHLHRINKKYVPTLRPAMRIGLAALYLSLTAGINSCKKDLLHLQNVQRLNSQTSCRINNVQFIDDNTAVLAGGDIWSKTAVCRSTNGGYTWIADTSATVAGLGKAMFGMDVAANGAIYLCGVDGDVLHSADSGRTWNFNRIDNWLHYVGGTFCKPDTGIFVSTVLQRQCTITRVNARFQIIDTQTFLFGLNGIKMITPDKGYIFGYGTVMQTTNGGATWAFQDVKGDNFTAMEAHGEEMWLCGSSGGIYHTANGGVSWEELRNGSDITVKKYYLRCLTFKDSQHGWAAGDNGALIYTDDGGRHWAEYESFTTECIRALTLCPNGNLIAAGDNGVLFRIVL